MRLPIIVRLVLILGLLPLLPASESVAEAPSDVHPEFLEGYLLVAKPGMRDNRFRESVVYMIQHDEAGAVGLIVNKKIGSGPLSHLLRSHGIDAGETTMQIDLYYGGPVDGSKGFALHSGEFRASSTQTVDGKIYFSDGTAVLSALAEGKGPQKLRFAVGKARWWGGQLEGELDRGAWRVVKSRDDLVFGDGPVNAWDQITGAGGLPL